MSDPTVFAASRPAHSSDIPELARLYQGLSQEMEGLRRMWPLIDGLAIPVEDTLASLFDSPDWTIVLGLLDDTPMGFLAWRDEPMLPQAGGDRVASVRYIYTEPEARGVGVGEAMISAFLEAARLRGIRNFDAHVSPGHREAKNFFESNGFKARSIVMHRDESP